MAELYELIRAQGTPHGHPAARAVRRLPSGWQWYYQRGVVPTNGGDRYAAGVLAYKRELIFNDHGTGISLAVPVWGSAAAARTVAFQQSVGLVADGIVGPATARLLCRRRIERQEQALGIPDHLAGRQGTLESNNHAVAEGWADPDDEGWGQIHLPFHPDVTLAEAWDLRFAVSFLCSQLVTNQAKLRNWDAALAAYNVGFGTAKLWQAAGRPDHGGLIWHTPQGDVDSFTRAHEYVQLVRAAAW